MKLEVAIRKLGNKNLRADYFKTDKSLLNIIHPKGKKMNTNTRTHYQKSICKIITLEVFIWLQTFLSSPTSSSLPFLLPPP